MNGRYPLLLSSTIQNNNTTFNVDLMNPDPSHADPDAIEGGTVHLARAKMLWQDTCYEQICIHNYGLSSVNLTLTIDFDADYADIFEVRGTPRPHHGQRLPSELRQDAVLLVYEGLDGRIRGTRIVFDPAPDSLTETGAAIAIQLAPREQAIYQLAITCEMDAGAADSTRRNAIWSATRPTYYYEETARQAAHQRIEAQAKEPQIVTSNDQFNNWLNRSIADLHMLRTDTLHGPYPYAGVPWFSTPFGRDGIITALETLWHNPAIARGVLTYLAATQANAENPEQDAQPGKILHETRGGEMAELGEVPFGCYYGSVDATPLFVMLAGAYYERTGDRAFIRSIWTNIERALVWLDRFGDVDGDGFVEYARYAEDGLVQQGWKDSHDSVFHADGSMAEPPIALCEVQGYTFAAKLAGAKLASALELGGRVKLLTSEANALRHRFNEAFWIDNLHTYALALDGNKAPCRLITSNAGHCLFSGIATTERARQVAATLMHESGFSGWGVRTLATSEARYNPMSYHNGSIWPHDNALVAAGFSRYGLKAEAGAILTALYEASLYFDLHRLPELFCGFPKLPDTQPTEYPVSCSPQAWAAGSVLLLLQACLGMRVRGVENRVIFVQPHLPHFLEEVEIRGLHVNGASIDLSLTRHEEDVGVNVMRRDGNVAVIVQK